MYRTVAITLVSALLLTDCGSTTGDSTETEPSDQTSEISTPQTFVDALDAAITREGEVLHTTITVTSTAG